MKPACHALTVVSIAVATMTLSSSFDHAESRLVGGEERGIPQAEGISLADIPLNRAEMALTAVVTDA